jgi:hypothetical protein
MLSLSGSGTDWTTEAIDEGRACLARVGAEVDDADPGGLVVPRSRLLCAGLARLATEVANALGAGSRREEIADLAASISLLTKIDDEVIDALAFHGGARSEAADVARRTLTFLAPTLASMRAAEPVTGEPRCRLAAAVGLRIRRLAGEVSRAEALLDLLAQGWQTQVDAVATLTRDPREADLAQVDRVTRRISGDWLAIVSACGALPIEARRWLGDDEIEAVRDLGLYVQRTDSLCDLEKDQAEGLTSTWAACEVVRRAGRPASTLPELYDAVALHAVDAGAIPSRETSRAIAARLAELGGLASLLEWIRKMLLSRYLAHPLTDRARRAIVRSAARPVEAPCSAR